MRNLMTLRGVRTVTLAAALGAGCGGGDPPGGGNNGGTTDGGGTADGERPGTDGPHVPNPNNPLIAVIPGTWEFYEFAYEADGKEILSGPPDVTPIIGQVTVDRNDRDCSGDGAPPRGPIGDACIHWMRGPEEEDGDEGRGLVDVWWLVLIDDRVIYDPYRDPMRAAEGRALDEGQRIEYRTHPTGCAGGDGDDCTICPTGDCSEQEIPYDMWVNRFRKLE